MSDIQLTPEQIKLVNYPGEFFMPVKEASAGQVFYTTTDVFRKLQSLWLTDAYNTEDVLTVLLYKDYNRINSSGDKVFWSQAPFAGCLSDILFVEPSETLVQLIFCEFFYSLDVVHKAKVFSSAPRNAIQFKPVYWVLFFAIVYTRIAFKYTNIFKL